MAEALYNLCKFEYSLMGYQRAVRLSPGNETALMGIVKCRKTITGSLRYDIFDMTDTSGPDLAHFVAGIQNSGERNTDRKRTSCNIFFSLINELILGNTEPLNVSGGRNRLTNTRMRSDHEFLKHLKNILGPAGEASEEEERSELAALSEI